MAKAKSLSGRAFAQLDGTRPITVRRARQAGRIIADKQGRFDPTTRRNAAWLKRTKQTDQRNALSQAMRLEAAKARLERQEFEAGTWQAFYIERTALSAWLHAHADCLMAALRAFPGDEIELSKERVVPRFVPLLWSVEAEWPAFTTALRAAMAEHIQAMGDLHALVERALEDAGADWKGYRPIPPRGMAHESSREEPTTMVQVERRRAAATTALERMKVGIRRGDLLAAPPAERAVGRLVIGWRASVIEKFGVRHAALLLTEMARPVNHETQWTLFRALQGILKGIVAMAEHAVGGPEHDLHSDMRARFLPVIRSIVL